jgi:hypothetical protein
MRWLSFSTTLNVILTIRMTNFEFEFVNTPKTLASVPRTLKPKLSREYYWTETNHRRGFDPGDYSSLSKPASISFSRYLNPNLSPH